MDHQRLMGFVCVASVMLVGCGAPPPPAPPPAAAAPPPPQPITLDPIPELVVKAGTSGTARIEVNRAGHAGMAEVTIASPPAGLTVVAAPIAADSRTGTIVVTATETLGTSESVMPVQVTVSLDGMTAQENLNVKVPAFEPPTFEPQGNAIVQPGRTASATFRIDRKGYAGAAIDVKPPGDATGQQPAVVPSGTEGPGDVTCAPLTIAADSDVAEIAFSVSPAAPDGPRTIVLSGSTMSREFPAEFKVDVLAHPYRITPPSAISLAPGETRIITLSIDRKAYPGPIDLAVRDLPPGVTCEAAKAAAGEGQVSLSLVAEANAAPRVRAAKLETTGGAFGSDQALVVRVKSTDGEPLPAAVTAGPEAARLMKNTPLAGRLTVESKAVLSDLFGGTPDASAAVKRGLDWLARSQQPEGVWTLKGLAPTSTDEPAEEEPTTNPVFATAIALLPFLGEGITHQRAPAEPVEFQAYKGVVEKGLVALARGQIRDKTKADGYFGGGIEAHAAATQAFAETYALSRDDRLKFNVRQGVKCLGATQNADGSWGAEPGQPGDLLVTVAAVRALRMAQMAGLGVPGRTLKKAEQFLAACGEGTGDAPHSRYAVSAGRPATPLATAAAIATRLDLGCDRGDAGVQEAASFLMKNPPPPSFEGIGPIAYQAFATDAMHDVGGEDTDAWFHQVRERLVALQRREGDAAGSWPAAGSDREKDGGRLYATVASLLILQTPYRSLPGFTLPRKKLPAAVEPESTDTDAGDKDA